MSFYTNRIEIQEEYKLNFLNLKEIFNKENVHSYFVRIPQIKDLNEKAKHYEWKYEHLSVKANWTLERESEVRKNLKRFTELSYEEVRKKVLNDEKRRFPYKKDRKNRTIYLVGPCIVAGWEGIPGETLCELLYMELIRLGLDYNIVQVVISSNASFNNKAILEYDIKANDIIFFIDCLIDYEIADIDFSYIYNNYVGEKWLYSDEPIHTTRKGNELIIQELVQEIILPLARNSLKEFDQKIIHIGERQLTYEECIALQQYIESLKVYKKETGVIGACVMTCNPFTYGHYYLVEYASKQVDFLYLFVVQEDACYFSFADRLEMVKRGTSQFKNVIVLPSGQFIISKTTFKNYFEKEIFPDAIIDATKDTMIFREYIAPEMRITKRFVGEPNDNITNQYNQILKKELSDLIEVIEVPRKKISGVAVSASSVRRYLKENNWSQIEMIVPFSTFDYLKNDIVQINNNSEKSNLLRKIIEIINDQDKVVFCGLGRDAYTLMDKLEIELDKKSIEKIEYYDKKAISLNFSYKGKKVLNIKELVQKYRNAYMVITTSKYKKEIFCLLIKEGIHPEHITIIE